MIINLKIWQFFLDYHQNNKWMNYNFHINNHLKEWYLQMIPKQILHLKEFHTNTFFRLVFQIISSLIHQKYLKMSLFYFYRKNYLNLYFFKNIFIIYRLMLFLSFLNYLF